MFRFLIKKNFADIWDNLFHLIVLNLFTVFAGGICLAVVMLAAAVPVPDGIRLLCLLAAIALSCMIMGVLIFAEGDNALKIANFEGAKLSYYFKNILPSIKDGACFGLYLALVISIALVSIPYYASQGSLFGLVLLSFVFWFVIITVLALQYFLPIRSIMHNGFRKCLKKSYIIFFDNSFFTVGLGLLNLVNIAVAVFSLGILNGPATITLTCTEAMRLRLYKYDWYKVNPGLTKEQRKEVPWDDLIANDKKLLGPRHWKSFIFPWKD